MTTMITAPETVTSVDGTAIAFERTGGGQLLILVGGAFNDRSTVRGLATGLPCTRTTGHGSHPR